MAFQFQCPNGHLLEGDESQAGQPLNCPVCGMLFLVPAPLAPEPQPQPAAQQPAFQQPADPEVYHIPCPNRHILEVPKEMLDTEVLCPHCNAQFGLRMKDSIEYKKKKEKQEELREREMNKFWFNFSITAAVIVVLGLLTMIIASIVNKPEIPAEKAKPKAPPVVPVQKTPEEANPTEESTPMEPEMKEEKGTKE